jgi:hypothetical protein
MYLTQIAGVGCQCSLIIQNIAGTHNINQFSFLNHPDLLVIPENNHWQLTCAGALISGSVFFIDQIREAKFALLLLIKGYS